MCGANCSWVNGKEVFLYPWDAGTDSGISYMVRLANQIIPFVVTIYDWQFLCALYGNIYMYIRYIYIYT